MKISECEKYEKGGMNECNKKKRDSCVSVCSFFPAKSVQSEH